MGSDYLAYALIDTIVDNYYVVLEKIAEEIEGVEEAVLKQAKEDTIQYIHRMKKGIMSLRRSVWPLRDIINNFIKTDSKLIKPKTDLFFRDIYDHIIQVTDSIDMFRDMLSGLMDLHLSTLSNKMNEVMKVLTIFAAIFIPLTFLAGIYGMNFEYMPELKWKYSYFVIWGVFLLVGGGMLAYFKKRKWL